MQHFVVTYSYEGCPTTCGTAVNDEYKTEKELKKSSYKNLLELIVFELQRFEVR